MKNSPYVELKKAPRITIKTGFLVLFLLTTLLFGLLYASTRDDSAVLKHMQSWLLQGSTTNLKVNGLLFQYNGTETCLSGGTLYYTGNATNVKGYSYRVLLEDATGSKEPLVLLSSMVTADSAALLAEIPLGSLEGPAENIAYDTLAENYKAKLEFKLITATETVEEEVYLKTRELNTAFYKK